MKLLTNLINSVIDALDKIQRIRDNTKKQMTLKLKKIKKKLIMKLAEIFLYFVAIGLIITATIIFLTNFFAIELVMLGMGLLLLYVGLLIKLSYEK